MKPCYPRRDELPTLLDKIKTVSLKGLAGAAMLAVVALAPRCGGLQQYDHNHYKAKEMQQGPSSHHVQPKIQKQKSLKITQKEQR